MGWFSHDKGGIVKAHELFPCRDGSWTLKDPATGQAMHSEIGPLEEARRIFIAPARHIAEAPGGRLVIHDLGLGIAANAVAAIEEWKDRRPLRIVSFENDLGGIRTALSNPERFPHLASWEEALRGLLAVGRWESGSLSWELRVGPYEEQRPDGCPADLVFHDFYSPAVSPGLWGRQVFARVRETMSEQGLLLTYSAATRVRTALLLAGFRVGRGPGTPMKAESTQATVSGSLAEPLTRDWLEHVARSSRPFPDDSRLASVDAGLAALARLLPGGYTS
jgi:queuine tRNA-ribosyltransferase